MLKVRVHGKYGGLLFQGLCQFPMVYLKKGTNVMNALIKHLLASSLLAMFSLSVSAEDAATGAVAVESVAVEAVAVQSEVEQPAVQPQADAVQGQQININTADAQTIADGLVGVGLKKAEAIVAYRQQNGAFKSLEELSDVKGIGPATIEKNADKISF